MNFWRLTGTNRVIAVSVEVTMTPRWELISMEEFYRLRELFPKGE